MLNNLSISIKTENLVIVVFGKLAKKLLIKTMLCHLVFSFIFNNNFYFSMTSLSHSARHTLMTENGIIVFSGDHKIWKNSN